MTRRCDPHITHFPVSCFGVSHAAVIYGKLGSVRALEMGSDTSLSLSCRCLRQVPWGARALPVITSSPRIWAGSSVAS